MRFFERNCIVKWVVISNASFCWLWDFSTSPHTPQYKASNGPVREWFMMSFIVFATRNTRPSLQHFNGILPHYSKFKWWIRISYGTFLFFIVGVSHVSNQGKNFPQSHLVTHILRYFNIFPWFQLPRHPSPPVSQFLLNAPAIKNKRVLIFCAKT